MLIDRLGTQIYLFLSLYRKFPSGFVKLMQSAIKSQGKPKFLLSPKIRPEQPR